MHCEALRICLHAFNYAGAFVGEVRRICLHAFDYAGAFVGEARRICVHTFNYACIFVGICIVGIMLEQQKLSFYADTTVWDKTSCCFSKQKASKRQCRRPPTHRDRAGWVHCLEISTIWAIACRAYLEMTT